MLDDVQKNRRRKMKSDVCGWMLDKGRDIISASRLDEVDGRLLDYAIGVAVSPESHNLFELLALKRSLSFMAKYDFRAKEARRAVASIELLKFVGPGGMQPIRLSPVQVFMLAGIYGFYRHDGRRLVRNVLLFVPRKFGKTTIVAGISIKELVFGDSDGQIYVCANSYQQAKICFDNIRNSLRVLDRAGKRFIVNREVIFTKKNGQPPMAKCLASDPTTLDGLNASVYILDEYAQSKTAALRNVMATSTGTRENPLEIIITTASDVIEGPCASTVEAYRSILMGDSEDDSVFALIFEPDVDDREDDPMTWRKVQPHLGVTIKDDYYAEKWAKAQQTAEDMLAFRTKLLNIFAINESKAWITGDEVRSLFRPFSFDSLESPPPYCMVAIDLSVWDDFSAVCYGVYRPVTASFHYHIDYYLPEETLEKHANRELYGVWVEKGFLKLLPGKVIDYGLIVNDIIARNGKVLIAGIGYDPYKSKTAVNMLQASGAGNVLQAFRQTYGAFTAPVEELEMMIKTGKCTFSPNEITAWCFGNCVMDEDRNGNRKPVKYSASGKIDGAITALMATGMFSTFKR